MVTAHVLFTTCVIYFAYVFFLVMYLYVVIIYCKKCKKIINSKLLEARTIQPILDFMEIRITFLKKMPILEPHRITSVVLEISKVINRVYHTLKVYQLTEFKIFLLNIFFPSLSPGNKSENLAILDCSLLLDSDPSLLLGISNLG